MSRTRLGRWVPGIASALCLVVSGGPASSVDDEGAASEASASDALDESRAVQREANVEGVASQQRID